ncbi:hypothetical protein OGW15_21120 [Citrobacter sp. Cf039]|uniref:Uncharacterized protein n=3 Tax=Citrobacter freundii TaxID=546 RepID=A0AAI9HG29_CITFR|nr:MULTISPECIES: hypothetical protein [Citrobacter]RRN88912.1 hypothetical protein D2048_21905 [Morganella morganii]EKV7199361.1 hypothetical protein [Citrobacter freundii]EKW4403583.1 hypothetical protein [Citrobacter freundii]EKX8774912.1 hypothetical protein [Citrobacter freundii]ELF4152252.1 hypothetical protein [Citrobacter freundii]
MIIEKINKKLNLLIFIAFVIAVLLVSKNIIMINQGDFYRLTSLFISDDAISLYGSKNLSFPLLDEFKNITKYNYISSFSYIVYLYASIISIFTNSFDIQIFSSIMKIVFLSSLYLLFCNIFKKNIVNTLVFIIACIPIISPSNISIFTSFYQDQIILPLLPLVMYFSYRSDNKVNIFIAFILITIISTAKSQYFYSSIILFIQFLVFNRSNLKIKAYLTVASLLVSISAIMLSSGATQYNKYHSNYFGILYTLKENNYKIPEKYNIECIGVDAWGNILDINTGAVSSNIGESCFNKNKEIGFKDSIKNIIIHPLISLTLPFDKIMRSFYGEDYFHVYKGYKIIDCKDSFLCSIPTIKDKLFNDVRFPFLIIIAIISVFINNKSMASSLFMFSIFGITQLYICFIGEGYRDINKHLIGLNYSFDLIIFIFISFIGSSIHKLLSNKNI